MKINIPKLSFIALIGVANEEKSTFIQKHFSSNEMISLDYYKGVISNDKNAPDTAKDAFDIAKYSIQKRLQRGYLTAIDATNLQSSDRKDLVHLAKKHHVLPVAIVMNQKKDNSRSHKNRTDQHFLELKKAGFKQIFILNSREEIEAVNIIREKSPNDKSEFIGPFDIIGDVHGCFSELSTLLTKLGYTIIKHQNKMNNYGYSVLPPRNRKAIFVGDLVDRGP
ncbi:MAG: AAA family ATPase, partial [Saprospiraceae bacterium]|nr:AAA family ATPase [Saprospiraceae bacterium]